MGQFLAISTAPAIQEVMGTFGSSTTLRIPAVFDDGTDAIAEELRWLLHRDYESELGVRSSFEHQIEIIQLGGPRTPLPQERSNIAESALAAMSRLRELEDRWEKLCHRSQHILRCVYGKTPSVLSNYGALGPLVLFLSCRVAGAVRPQAVNRIAKWLESLKKREPVRFERTLRHARTVLNEARGQWMKTRETRR